MISTVRFCPCLAVAVAVFGWLLLVLIGAAARFPTGMLHIHKPFRSWRQERLGVAKQLESFLLQA